MWHAHAHPAVEVSAPANVTVLGQRRDLNPGKSQQEDSNNQNFSKDRIAKDKARHMVALLAAYCI